MLERHDITRLYDRHAHVMLGFFARRTFDPDVAVDLVAETFARAFVERRRFRGETDSEQAAWLYGIAKNLLADWRRKAHVERRAMAKLGVERRALTEAEYDRIEELAGLDELRDDIRAGLDHLSDDHRDALQLGSSRSASTATSPKRLASPSRRPAPASAERSASCAVISPRSPIVPDILDDLRAELDSAFERAEGAPGPSHRRSLVGLGGPACRGTRCGRARS